MIVKRGVVSRGVVSRGVVSRGVVSRGVAAVELAITLPVLVAFVLGSVEVCNLIFLRQALISSTYEAARISIRKDSTTALATARAQEILASRGVTGATITFDPSDIESVPRGTPISVTATAPANSFSIIPILEITSTTLSASTNMVKE